MTKTAEFGPIEDAARLCYRWYRQDAPDEEGMAAIASLLGSPMGLEEMKRLDTRMRQTEQFRNTQAKLFQNWRSRFESPAPLGEDAAQQFLQELFDGFDHNLLFERGVTASSTHILRNEVNDSETWYPGDMHCWTLHFTTAGSALVLNGHMEQQVGPGDLMLFRPEAQYHCGLHPAASEWRHLWALFQPLPHWSEVLEWQRLDEGIFYIALADAKERAKVTAVFNELLALKNDPGPYQIELQYNKLEELLLRAKTHDTLPGEPLDKRVQKACDFMQGNLASGFRIDDVAASCSLSTSRLAHLFTLHMGISPKSWSNNLRLQRARKLLLAKNESINAIAGQVGYEDPSQFTRYFKKSMGCSPREFRRSFGK